MDGAVQQAAPSVCKKGHIGARRNKDGRCTVCRRENTKNWRKLNEATERPAKIIRQRRYALKNADRIRRQRWRQRGVLGHIPPMPEPMRCDSCGDTVRSIHRMHLDHVHETGAFRGWLCGLCNTGLGHMKDSIDRLEKLIAYMKSRGY